MVLYNLTFSESSHLKLHKNFHHHWSSTAFCPLILPFFFSIYNFSSLSFSTFLFSISKFQRTHQAEQEHAEGRVGDDLSGQSQCHFQQAVGWDEPGSIHILTAFPHNNKKRNLGTFIGRSLLTNPPLSWKNKNHAVLLNSI